MEKKKKIFFGVAILFVLIMAVFTFDFMSRTTMPGKKKHLPESLTPNYRR